MENYVIRRCGSIRQAKDTMHYIVTTDGRVAFRLHGEKRDQVIYRPRERGLKYHVEVYRSCRGRIYITVVDMWENKVVAGWCDLEGAGGLLELCRKYPFLEKIVKEETVLPAY